MANETPTDWTWALAIGIMSAATAHIQPPTMATQPKSKVNVRKVLAAYDADCGHNVRRNRK